MIFKSFVEIIVPVWEEKKLFYVPLVHLVETSANKNFKICAGDDRIMKMKKAVKTIVDTVSRHTAQL